MSRTYLAHHELESDFIIITTITGVIVIAIVIVIVIVIVDVNITKRSRRIMVVCLHDGVCYKFALRSQQHTSRVVSDREVHFLFFVSF